MNEELDALRAYRSDVPPPSDAARRFAEALMTEAGEQKRLSEHRPRNSRIALIAAAAALITGAVVIPLTRLSNASATVRFQVPTGVTASRAALEESAAVLKARATALGLTMATVRVVGNQVVAMLPKAASSPALLEEFSAPATLYFRPVLCNAPSYDPRSAPRPRPATIASLCAGRYRYQPTTASGEGLQPPPLDGALAGFRSTAVAYDVRSPDGYVLLPSGPGGLAPRYVLGPSIADGSFLGSEPLEYDAVTQRWVVVFDFTQQGAARFAARVAQGDDGHIIAVDYDGAIRSAPLVTSQLSLVGGLITTTTHQSARAIAAALKSGALPVPLIAEGDHS